MDAGGMESECELDTAERKIEAAAGIQPVGLRSLGREILGDFIIGDDRGLAALRDAERIARMVLVAVGAEDVVDLDLGGLDWRKRTAGEEWVDDEAEPGRFDEETRMGEIRDFH